MSQQITFFDLFSGIGGFRLGLQQASPIYKCVGACEIDEYARRIYFDQFGDYPEEDAVDIRGKYLPDFDLLTAGFPCQAFSIAGGRLGFEESRGTVFYEIARIAKEKRPRFLLLENVKGLLSHEAGLTFIQIIATLEELGYDIQWQVLNSKYWIPQNRERIYIIGSLRDQPRPQVFPLSQGQAILDAKNTGKQGSKASIWSEGVVSTIDSRYGALRNSGETYIMLTEPKIKQLNDNSYHDTDRLYDVSGIARTLRANSGGVGSKTGAYLVDNDIRQLTPKECERLQGFPDDWTKGVSDTQRYKMLGNAVSVPVVKRIGEELLHAI